MINKSTAEALKVARPAAVKSESTGMGYLWTALALHAMVMAWLLSLIF